jgi:Mn-dependent DtxR family transcriptional regulator
MGQREVLKLLNDNKGRMFTSREISLILDQNFPSVSVNCNKLRRSGMIHAVPIPSKNAYRFCV